MPDVPDESDSLIDFCFSSPLTESPDDETRDGRR
jgi:hypothetical protein